MMLVFHGRIYFKFFCIVNFPIPPIFFGNLILEIFFISLYLNINIKKSDGLSRYLICLDPYYVIKLSLCITLTSMKN